MWYKNVHQTSENEMYWVIIIGGSSLSMHRPYKSMTLVVHPHTQCIEGGTMCTIIYQYSKKYQIPHKTPAPFLGTVFVQLVLWVSHFSVSTSPFPAPSRWIRGRAQCYVLQTIRPLFLVLSHRTLPGCLLSRYLSGPLGQWLLFIPHVHVSCLPCSLLVSVLYFLVVLVALVFQYVNVRRHCLASPEAWTDLTSPYCLW